jgi:hypothetical protein
MMNYVTAMSHSPHTRKSSDACWPLRGADGLTFAQRKQRADELKTKTGDTK